MSAKLVDASEHLAYEVKMFFETAAMLASRVGSQSAGAASYASTASDQGNLKPLDILDSALLESLLVHARVLLDFLYEPRRRKDDVVAKDYAQGWNNARPPIASELSKLKKRVNKEVAHLSYVRLNRPTETNRQWGFIKLAREMRHVILAFWDAADAKRFHPYWQALVPWVKGLPL